MSDKVSGRNVLLGIGAAIVAGVTAPHVLAAVGFKATGVVAGTIAAAVQTPNTVAGSWFALCQSAGVLGLAAKTTAGIAATAGTATTAVLEMFNRRSN